MAITVSSMFPFSPCKDWVQDQAIRLKAIGCAVEVVVNTEQLPTIVVKVTSDAFVADLVVWEYGRSSMQVFDLKKGEFVLELHDIDLTSHGYATQMQVFFDLIAKST
jgi:hypothetical protein